MRIHSAVLASCKVMHIQRGITHCMVLDAKHSSHVILYLYTLYFQKQRKVSSSIPHPPCHFNYLRLPLPTYEYIYAHTCICMSIYTYIYIYIFFYIVFTNANGCIQVALFTSGIVHKWHCSQVALPNKISS